MTILNASTKKSGNLLKAPRINSLRVKESKELKIILDIISNISIESIGGTLTGTTTLGQSGFGSNRETPHSPEL